MRKAILVVLAMALVPFCAFAVDGVTLINQSTVMAAGGFPYTISNPGSYRLSGNLTVADANTTAILVTVDNVTIDLNGFSIIGPTVCTGSPVTSCSPTGIGNGVDGQNHRDITVVNGGVRGMGNNGIELGRGSGGHVEKVAATSNGSGGINVAYGTVSGSEAAFNRFVGIAVVNSTASGNVVTSNGSDGIFAAFSTVSGNVATSNFGTGIAATSVSTVSGNMANSNGTYGIFAFCPSSVVGNTATDNSPANLHTAGAGCALANNAAP